MQSLSGLMMRAQLRLFKPIMKIQTVEASRKTQDALGILQAKSLAKEGVSFENAEIEGVSADFALPKKIESEDKVVLYLHGGGYVAGSLAYARVFGGHMAYHLKRKVLCIGYRLAPEYPFPAALDDAFSGYMKLLDLGYAPENIAVMGESAGGGLTFALGLFLKQQGIKLPACFIGISPWTDLAMTGEAYFSKERKDPSLFPATLKEYAKMYAGKDLKNPLISPAYGDFTYFPPCLIFAGTYEVLEDDAKMLNSAIIKGGAKSTLVLADGMWHVYILYGTPEAKEAVKRITEFINEHT